MDVAVPLVDDIVMLRVEPACHLGMAAERVDHYVVVPGEITVTGASLISPDVAAFAVDHRGIILDIASGEVEGASRIGPRVIPLDLGLPVPAGPVGMPRIDVGFDMVPQAGGIVFSKAGRIQPLGQAVHRAHPLLDLGVVVVFPMKTPGLVEIDPCEDGRVVIVALHLRTHAVFPVLASLRHRLAPEIGGVGHDQETELVGPV